MIRVLTDAGMNDSLAVWTSLAMLVPVCWFICAKLEPAIRGLVKAAIANKGLRSTTTKPSGLPAALPGLRHPLPLGQG
jgi:hypothetical protein